MALPLLLSRAFDRRARALARDVRTVVDNLRGVRAPALVRRPPRRPHHPEPTPSPTRATSAAARELEILELRRETADAVSVVLADPSGAPVRFTPGQFFTVLVDVDGEPLRRAYSASSSYLAPATVTLTVKRVDGGRVSGHINDRLRPGDRLAVLGPSGDFTVVPSATARRHVVLIGAGSGITPLMAISRAILAVEPASRVSLIYGNRSAATVIFRAELAALAAAHPDRLTIRHVLEDTAAADPDITATAGRLDRVTLAAELDAIAAAPDDRATDYYVCGPEPVMTAARAELVGRGVAADRLHEERFASPQRRTTADASTSAQPVTLRRPGGDQLVIVPAGATILDAGLEAGAPLAFSCAMGGCGACAVTVTAGDVVMEEPTCLSDDERARGIVLACVARPLGPCTIAVPR